MSKNKTPKRFNSAKEAIKYHEGFKGTAYPDGKTKQGKQLYSIGYGFNDSGAKPNIASRYLEARKSMSQEYADRLLDDYILELKGTLSQYLGYERYKGLTEGQLIAFLDTGYQNPAAMKRAATLYKKGDKEGAANALRVEGFEERNEDRRAAFLDKYSPRINNTSLIDPSMSIYDALRQAGVRFNTSNPSGYRTKEQHSRFSSGENSWHRHLREDGKTAWALDITPDFSRGATWETLQYELTQNGLPEYFAANGLAILDETDPAIKKRTGATGDHYHIGKDRIAHKKGTYKDWVTKYSGQGNKYNGYTEGASGGYNPYVNYGDQAEQESPDSPRNNDNNKTFYEYIHAQNNGGNTQVSSPKQEENRNIFSDIRKLNAPTQNTEVKNDLFNPTEEDSPYVAEYKEAAQKSKNTYDAVKALSHNLNLVNALNNIIEKQEQEAQLEQQSLLPMEWLTNQDNTIAAFGGNLFESGGSKDNGKYTDDFMRQYSLDWTPFSQLYSGDPYYSKIKEHELATSNGKEGRYATNAEGRYVPVSELNKLWNDYLLTQPQVNNKEELEVSRVQQHRQNQEFNRQADNFFTGNWLFPSQFVGAAARGITGDDRGFWNNWLLGNAGVVTDSFAQEHPYWSAAANLAFDVLGPNVKGLTNAIGKGINTYNWNNFNRTQKALDDALREARQGGLWNSGKWGNWEIPKGTIDVTPSTQNFSWAAARRREWPTVQEDAEYLSNPVLRRLFIERSEKIRNKTATPEERRFVDQMKKVIIIKKTSRPVGDEVKQASLDYYNSDRYKNRVKKALGNEYIADSFIKDANNTIKNTPITVSPNHPTFVLHPDAVGVTYSTGVNPVTGNPIPAIALNIGGADQPTINHEINHAVDMANPLAIQHNAQFPLVENSPSPFIQGGKPYYLDDIEPRTRAIALDMFLAEHPEYTIDDAYKSWYDNFHTDLNFNDMPIDAREFITHYDENTGRNYFDNFFGFAVPVTVGTAASNQKALGGNLYANGEKLRQSFKPAAKQSVGTIRSSTKKYPRYIVDSQILKEVNFNDKSDPIAFALNYYKSPGFQERFRKYAPKYMPKGIQSYTDPLKLNAIEYGGVPEIGTYIRPTKTIFIDQLLPTRFGVTYDDVLSHELGHAISDAIYTNEKGLTRGAPFSEYTRASYADIYPVFRENRQFKDFLKTVPNPNNYKIRASIDSVPHDASPEESYADLISLRYDLYKNGIFDSTKAGQVFTKDLLNKYKKEVLKNRELQRLNSEHPNEKINQERLFDNFTDDQIIQMLNEVAYNLTIPNSDSVNYADDGGILRKVYGSNANFVNRLKDKNRAFVLDWENPTKIATHKLSVGQYGKFGEKTMIYPEIQEVNGALVDFSSPVFPQNAGIDNAIRTGDYVDVGGFDTFYDALNFTKDYKKYFPRFDKK